MRGCDSMPDSCSFSVVGTPAPQGSKRHVGKGRMVEQSKLVRPWREAVKWAWIEARQRGQAKPILGPVSVSILFRFERPAKPKYGFPCAKDIDKLQRATFDALTEAGAIEDDRFVVRAEALKTWADQSGAAVFIQEVRL